MEYGFTPSDVRKRNQLLVLQSLRSRPATYLELAGKLNLSTTAINNIIADLVERGILRYSGSIQKNRAGRKALIADLNESYGLIALVQFASTSRRNYFTVSVCDLKERELAREQIPPVTGDTVTLNKLLRAALDKLLAGIGDGNGKLLTICIAAPGMVDDATGELIATCLKRGDGEYNIKEYLEECYRVPVHVRSLLSCYAKAELKKGALAAGCKFGIVFNVDEGIGMSFVMNGQTFTGAHGYAGEIGFLKNVLTAGAAEDLAERARTGLGSEITVLSVAASASRRLALIGYDAVDLSLEKLYELYDQKNSIVLEEVYGNARKVGAILANLTLLLDPDHIVITGAAVNFGEAYLDILKDTLSSVSKKRVNVAFSQLENAIYDGLIDSAVNIVFDRVVRD